MKDMNLQTRMLKVDEEFKDYMSELRVIKRYDETQLKTFSPLDVLGDFKQKGLQKVREVSVDEMKRNDDGLRKLLANMLGHCRPGVLSNDDIEQLSGINGREVRGGL